MDLGVGVQESIEQSPFQVEQLWSWSDSHCILLTQDSVIWVIDHHHHGTAVRHYLGAQRSPATAKDTTTAGAEKCTTRAEGTASEDSGKASAA